MQFKYIVLAASTIVFLTLGGTKIDSAYGHGCQAQGWGCFTSYPTGILSNYVDAISIISVVGMALIVAMLFFRFDYLQSRDFHTVKYSPMRDRIGRLFEGRDKRKIMAAMPFLAFGGLLLAASLQTLITYGHREYEVCSSYRTPFCQTTTYADTSFLIILHSLPFIGGGMFLLVTGLKAISIVTMKKEAK